MLDPSQPWLLSIPFLCLCMSPFSGLEDHYDSPTHSLKLSLPLTSVMKPSQTSLVPVDESSPLPLVCPWSCEGSFDSTSQLVIISLLWWTVGTPTPIHLLAPNFSSMLPNTYWVLRILFFRWNWVLMIALWCSLSLDIMDLPGVRSTPDSITDSPPQRAVQRGAAVSLFSTWCLPWVRC